MKERLKKLLARAGASASGVCAARIFSELEDMPGLSDTVFCESDIKKRINPFLLMPEAQSVLCFIVSYKSSLLGNISQYAYGRDYHKVLREVADTAVDALHDGGFAAEVFCDSSPLPERYLAYLAGLGFIGKNRCLIHPNYGSFVFIGYILTDCRLAPDKPIGELCADCGKCLSVCPSGALSDGDFSKCISYITQKKGELSKAEEELIKNSPSIWGCDLCQSVCPHNLSAPEATLDAFCENLICELYVSEDISNRAFSELYSDRAFSWRGKNVILRNERIKK